jgi:hypothetical protein
VGYGKATSAYRGLRNQIDGTYRLDLEPSVVAWAFADANHAEGS